MITVAGIEPKDHIKQDQSLHIDIITIGIIDAFHHFPGAFQRKSDIAALSTKFAMFYLQIQREDDEEHQESDDTHKKQYSISSVIGNFIAGYLLGKRLCIIADDEKRQMLIDTFCKIDEGNDDDMLSLVFDAVKESVEDFVKTTGVDSISAFSGKAMQDGGVLMGVMKGDEEALVTKKNNEG